MLRLFKMSFAIWPYLLLFVLIYLLNAYGWLVWRRWENRESCQLITWLYKLPSGYTDFLMLQFEGSSESEFLSVLWLTLEQSQACTLNYFRMKLNWKVQTNEHLKVFGLWDKAELSQSKGPWKLMRCTSFLQLLFCSAGLCCLVLRTWPSTPYNVSWAS